MGAGGIRWLVYGFYGTSRYMAALDAYLRPIWRFQLDRSSNSGRSLVKMSVI